MTNRTSLLVASASVLALLASAPAYAQDSDDDVITISATKRQTTLQDTPVAVSVTSSEVIEKANIQDIKDLQSVVPTLRVTQLQSAQNTNFTIRGFGNGANNAGIEPAVGVFIDGVYRSRAAAQIGDLPKLERIEVLSGPQSTLYGKNSSAGVISVISAKPSDQEEGYIEVGYGNYNRKSVKAYVNGGNDEDDFAFSIGGSYLDRDGYGDGTDQPDQNDRNRWSIRAQALWNPTDTFEARIIVDQSEIDEQCCVIGLVDAIDGTRPDGSAINGSGVAGAIGVLGGEAFSPFDYKTDFDRPSDNFVEDGGISLHADWDVGIATLTSITSKRVNEGGYDTEIDYTSARIAPSLRLENDIDTFTQELRLTSNGDNTLDWLIGGFYFNEDIESRTSLDYGEDIRAFVDLLAGGPGALQLIESANGFAVGETFFQAGQGTGESFTQENEAFSIFGQVDFDVTDQLTLTLGANYTDDKKDVTMTQTRNTDAFSAIDLRGTEGIESIRLQSFLFGVAPIPGLLPNGLANFQGTFGLPPTPENIGLVASGGAGAAAAAGFAQYNGAISAVAAGAVANDATNPFAPLFGLQFQPPLSDFAGSSNDDEITYTARLGYEVNDDLNVFASYSTGYKATSFNLSRDSRPQTIQPGDHPNQGVGTRLAEPEEAEVIEIGLKARFDWGALNIVAFDQSVKNFQTNLFTGTGFALANAGKQSSRGVEWDVMFKATDDLTFTLAGTYLDSEYDEFIGATGPLQTVVDNSGETVGGIHPLSLVVSGNYNHDFGNGTNGYLRASVLYESETDIYSNIDDLTDEGFNITNSANGADDFVREVLTVDASAGLTLDNGLGIQLWGRNLFNDEYLTTVFDGVAQAGLVYGYPNEPRTYGILLRKNF